MLNSLSVEEFRRLSFSKSTDSLAHAPCYDSGLMTIRETTLPTVSLLPTKLSRERNKKKHSVPAACETISQYVTRT
jgi:hypothetical protein